MKESKEIFLDTLESFFYLGFSRGVGFACRHSTDSVEEPLDVKREMKREWGEVLPLVEPTLDLLSK